MVFKVCVKWSKIRIFLKFWRLFFSFCLFFLDFCFEWKQNWKFLIIFFFLLLFFFYLNVSSALRVNVFFFFIWEGEGEVESYLNFVPCWFFVFFSVSRKYLIENWIEIRKYFYRRNFEGGEEAMFESHFFAPCNFLYFLL